MNPARKRRRSIQRTTQGRKPYAGTARPVELTAMGQHEMVGRRDARWFDIVDSAGRHIEAVQDCRALVRHKRAAAAQLFRHRRRGTYDVRGAAKYDPLKHGVPAFQARKAELTERIAAPGVAKVGDPWKSRPTAEDKGDQVRTHVGRRRVDHVWPAVTDRAQPGSHRRSDPADA